MRELLESVTCPNCWCPFKPEEVHWRSEHQDLIGDPFLGELEQLRFLPNRFDITGNAIDARGEACKDLACPHCHLFIPRAALERESLFCSILGMPSSGKSCYLGALFHELRRHLPERFKIRFGDAHPAGNQILSSYVQSMFLNENRHAKVDLHDLVAKTSEFGHLYVEINRGSQTVSYPKPFSFLIELGNDHPQRSIGTFAQRLLTLYDNAGEHFLAGKDTTSNPGTRHLIESSFLLFLFDPTQDPRWYAAMEKAGISSLNPSIVHHGQQELVLEEAAARIRSHTGLLDSALYDKPLVIIVSKSDSWQELLIRPKNLPPLVQLPGGVYGVNKLYVDELSKCTRDLLRKLIPQVTHTAESLWKTVYYLPASALGTTPTHEDGRNYIRPVDIKPSGVVLPFLVGLASSVPELVPFGMPDQIQNGHSNLSQKVDHEA